MTESRESARSTEGKPDWLGHLETLEGSDEVDTYLAARPELHRRAAVERGTREIVKLARQDLDRAERLAKAMTRLAEIVDEDYSQALALRARGHLRTQVGDNRGALALYRACQERFLSAGAEVEMARNLGSSMWIVALLGDYDQAWEDSRRAREILEPLGDAMAIARITSIEGNIFLRQDRHYEALDRYRTALTVLRRGGATQATAITLHNIAVSCIALNDFEGALTSYRELSRYCKTEALSLLAAQADYNIAYLYFFRGEYKRAIRVYQETRETCAALGDRYHLALCDLDQAEIYLELNLASEAARLARSALDSFEELGSGYEAGKALAFLGLAASKSGDTRAAYDHFSKAHDRFEAEGNRAWLAMVDFYTARVLVEDLRPGPARQRCSAARDFFEAAPWPSRVALCDLLFSRMDLQEGKPRVAWKRCTGALERLEPLDLPALELQAHVAIARCEEAMGDTEAALASYQRAHALLENLRTHLDTEESKLAFFGDKLEVYESLFAMTLEGSTSEAELEQAFDYMEQAKSRILADLVASGGSAFRTASLLDSELSERLRTLREELSHHHHQLRQLYDRGTSGVETGSPAEGIAQAKPKIEAVTRKAAECEVKLLETMRELQASKSHFASLHTARTAGFDEIRASIPEGTVLLEYFESRGVTYASVLNSKRLQIQAVADRSELQPALGLFRSQMSKYQLGEDYLKRFKARIDETTYACLADLYSLLIEPVQDRLDGDHLVVVPHGALHQVPFHALRDGEQYLIDRFSISYAPSASLFMSLQRSSPYPHHKSLVLGIPDEKAPEIRDEVETVGRILPDASLYLSAEATRERLAVEGKDARYVHIATHGFFRQDNPMFSAIQLGDSRLTLLDLYDLRLEAELVVLSGCSTGLHRVETGDELIGLTRGLFYAGAKSLIVTLWNVHDRSTSVFMKAFYGRLGAGADRAPALRDAMREVRAEYPSPYHWAPFVLVGRPFVPSGLPGTRAPVMP